jgi:cyclic-di-GMP-binding biofilm dispersal mediator protein
MEIQGARALVIGATGELGAAVARELAARGATLALSGRDAEALDALAGEVGGTATAADLREPGAPERVVREAHDAIGRLDVVVNAPGVVAFGEVAGLEESVLREMVEVDLIAPILVTRAFLEFAGEGAVLVNVSAIVAEMPTAGMAAYSGVKAGLTGFDAAAARELRRRRMRLLDVRPPHLETGFAGRALAGAPPPLAEGLDPREAARLIADAVADDRAREVDWSAATPRAR